MSKIYDKFKSYIKEHSIGYSDYEGFSTSEMKSCYEAGYAQAAQEIMTIWHSPNSIKQWLNARQKEGLIYINFKNK